MIYIFHVICYFARFSFTFACATANSSDVIRFLSWIFVQFRKPLAIYCDRGHHFDSEETKTFIDEQGISITFSASGASKSTGMIEVSNRILEGVMRKGNSAEWDQDLAQSTHHVNGRVIHHLQAAPSTIFLGLEPSVADLDAKLAFIPPADTELWVTQISDPTIHAQRVRGYCNYRAQTHDRVRQLSLRKKEQDAIRYNAGVTRVYHKLGTMVMIYQKKPAKMEARWRGPFRITGYGGVHGLSWEVSQLNGRNIRGAFHGHHLKPFHERTGYLATGETFEQSQTVRRRRARGGRPSGLDGGGKSLKLAERTGID